jgi:hypothetical protein
MREDVNANEGMCVVGHLESPHEIPQIESEGQQSVDGDGNAFRCVEVVVDTFVAS